MKKEIRVGEEKYNNKGTLMKIIRYENITDLDVEFQDEYKYKTKAYYQNFKKGTILNPYDKSIYGVGYSGIGSHPTRIDKNKMSLVYSIWHSLISRCYNEKMRHNFPAYENCIVCDEWHNFQVFADWYEDNYYNDNSGGRMHMDKDILITGNRLYSPETCIFVPQRINMIFMTKFNKSGLPTGVSSYRNKFRSKYNNEELGIFITLDEAVKAHEDAKRIHIKQVANEYKDKIPQKLYDVLINW